MIVLIFERVSELVFIRIEGSNVTFSNSVNGLYGNIDGLKFDYEGAIKENPDLKDNDDWHDETLSRLKEKIQSYETELEISDYIIKELKGVGYLPLYRKKQGFRKEVLQ